MKNKIVVTRRNDLVYTIEYDGSQPLRIIPSRINEANLGSIYVGRVSKIKKELGAAFVDFLPGITGFLSWDDVTGDIKQGDNIIVRVTAEPVKTKGYSLSMKLEMAGEYVVVSQNMGHIGISKKLPEVRARELKTYFEDKCEYSVLLRTNSINASINDIFGEYELLNNKMKDIMNYGHTRALYTCLHEEAPSFLNAIKDIRLENIDEIVVEDPEIFDIVYGLFPEFTVPYKNKNVSMNALYRVERAISLGTEKKVNLPSGGFLIIERTEALTVIDVNSGKFDSKRDRDEMIGKVNEEAARECARQMILRNLSGIILVDFINPAHAEQEEVLLKLMKELVKKDNVKCTVHGFSNLKLMEITRQKIRGSIYEYMLTNRG